MDETPGRVFNEFGILYGLGATTAPTSTAKGTAGQALIVGPDGKPVFGAVDLAGGGVTGLVPPAKGGTGQDSSASTGIAHVAAGTWSFSPVALATGDVSGDLPYANLAQAPGLSVLGVTGDVTADVAPIVATSNDLVLRRRGTTMFFGTVRTDGINDAAVTYAKIQDVSAASRLLGRGSAAGSGDVEEITPGTGLSMSGTTLSTTAKAVMQFWSVTAVPISATYYLGRRDSVTESDVWWMCPVSGSIVALYTIASVAGVGAGESWTYTLRVLAGDTALLHTVTGTGVNFGVSTGAVSVTASNVVSVKIVTSGGAAVAQHMVTIAIAT